MDEFVVPHVGDIVEMTVVGKGKIEREKDTIEGIVTEVRNRHGNTPIFQMANGYIYTIGYQNLWYKTGEDSSNTCKVIGHSSTFFKSNA